MGTLYDFTTQVLAGPPLALSAYRGKVALVVNTASHCSFTPQYQGMQELHEKYRESGLVVLAFPCNQFGKQEPGEAGDIRSFCQKNYGVSFPMFEKVEVNGAGAHPLYKWLTSAAPGFLGTRSIKWNFTKFLIGRDGKVVRRYGSWTKPQSIAADVEKMLT